MAFQYKLASGILQKYPGDDIRDLVAAYIAVQADADCLYEELLEMTAHVNILEAENRILKKHPVRDGEDF